MAGLMDFLQAASNTAASNVSGPVDGLAWLLKKAGVDVGTPMLGSQWMEQQGLTKPVSQSAASLAGETAALLAPFGIAAKAPQIASAALKGQELAGQGAMAVGRQGADMAGDYMARSGLLQPATVWHGSPHNNPPMTKALPYQIEHKPMTVAGGASPLHDLTQSFGEDIYGSNALRFFGSGDKREATTLRVMKAVKGNPDAQVTIYRGVPSDAGKINAGDWVTLDKSVAEDYARQQGGKVLEKKVPAKHITSWADSLLEFGYFPE